MKARARPDGLGAGPTRRGDGSTQARAPSARGILMVGPTEKAGCLAVPGFCWHGGRRWTGCGGECRHTASGQRADGDVPRGTARASLPFWPAWRSPPRTCGADGAGCSECIGATASGSTGGVRRPRASDVRRMDQTPWRGGEPRDRPSERWSPGPSPASCGRRMSNGRGPMTSLERPCPPWSSASRRSPPAADPSPDRHCFGDHET
jgi:hypothetical protein